MDDMTRELLSERIKTDIEGLSVLEPGSEQKEKEVENLTKLCKLCIDEDNSKRENEDARKKSIVDILKIASEVGLTAANFVFVGYWMRKTFKFEETGSITSAAGRNMLNKVFKLTK